MPYFQFQLRYRESVRFWTAAVLCRFGCAGPFIGRRITFPLSRFFHLSALSASLRFRTSVLKCVARLGFEESNRTPKEW